MKFISKYRNLTLTIEPDEVEEVKGKTVKRPGKHIQFTNRVYTTNDKEEIKFLKNHKNFGTDFFMQKPSVVNAVKEKVGQAKKQGKAEEEDKEEHKPDYSKWKKPALLKEAKKQGFKVSNSTTVKELLNKLTK